jgi:hypothetical protein
MLVEHSCKRAGDRRAAIDERSVAVEDRQLIQGINSSIAAIMSCRPALSCSSIVAKSSLPVLWLNFLVPPTPVGETYKPTIALTRASNLPGVMFARFHGLSGG